MFLCMNLSSLIARSTSSKFFITRCKLRSCCVNLKKHSFSSFYNYLTPKNFHGSTSPAAWLFLSFFKIQSLRSVKNFSCAVESTVAFWHFAATFPSGFSYRFVREDFFLSSSSCKCFSSLSSKQRATSFLLCSPVALEMLKNTKNLHSTQLSAWIKDFHYLFMQQRYDILTKEAYNILPHIQFLRPTEFVMIANHFSRCNFNDKQWWMQYSQYIMQNLTDIDGKDVSLLLNSMAQLNIRHEDLLKLLCKEAIHWSSLNSARSSALILNALTRLNYAVPEVFRAICEKIKSMPKELNGIDIGNIANACSRSSYVDFTLFKLMAERIIEIVDELNEHHIATIAWSFSCMNFRNPKMLDALAAQLRKISQERTISENYLPSILRAYGRVCHSNSDLVEVIRKDVPNIIYRMLPVDAVSTLTGMARCRMSELTDIIKCLLKTILDKLNKREIDCRLASNAAMAASKLQCLTYLDFWQGLSSYLIDKLHELKGEDLANVALAFSKLQGNHPWRLNVFKSIIQILPECVMKLTPRALSNIAVSLAKLDLYDYSAMKSISDAAIKNVHKFNAWDTTELLRSFAFFNLKDEMLFKTFSVHIARNLANMNSFQIDAVSSAFLKLGIEDASLNELLLSKQTNQAKIEKDSHYFKIQEISQNYSAQEKDQEQRELYVKLDEENIPNIKQKKNRRF